MNADSKSPGPGLNPTTIRVHLWLVVGPVVPFRVFVAINLGSAGPDSGFALSVSSVISVVSPVPVLEKP